VVFSFEVMTERTDVAASEFPVSASLNVRWSRTVGSRGSGETVQLQHVGGWLTVIFMGLSLIGLVAVHVLPTGLNPLRDPVSQYHLTRFRPVILVATLSAAVAGVGAILVLSGLLGAAAVVCNILLGVFVVARAAIPFLRMDEPGTRVTAVGRIHTVLAFGAFGPAVAVAFVAGGALHDAGFPDVATWSTVFGVVGAVGAVGLLVGFIARRSGLLGFFERLIYLGFIGWFLLIGFTGLLA
jgi:hypothetical protein